MKKRTKIPNMQRRPKGRKPASQKGIQQPSVPIITDAQMAEFMANAEAAFASNGDQTRYFVHGPMGLHSQQEPDQTWRVPFQDGLGSIRGVTDDALSILESREYDPFGNSATTHGLSQTPFGFAGEMTAPNGLVHLRARDYDPTLGVFPNLDPVHGQIQQPLSLNLYAYAQNNPVNWVDPSGMVRELPGKWDPCGNPQQQEGSCSCCPPDQFYPCQMGFLPPCSCTSPCPGSATTVYPNANDQCCYAYIPGNAVGYALDNVANLPSPGYENWGGHGGDCANFVSQALRDGNLPMHDTFGDEPEWGCKTLGYKTCYATNQNWTVAPNLRNYLVDHIGASVVSVPSPVDNPEFVQPNQLGMLMASLSAIQPGDVLYMPAGSAAAHVALVVQLGPAYASWQDFLSQQNELPYTVPYIVDHGFLAQGIQPRPFYLLGWPPPVGEGYFDGTGDWEFIRMSNISIRCVPVDKIIPFIPPEER